MSDSKLFSDFPPISGEEWRKKIECDLKGADFDRKLVWKTDEGFNLQPYYRMEDLDSVSPAPAPGQIPVFSKSSALKDNDWLIRQDFKISGQAAACNTSILNAVSRGAQSVGLDLTSAGEISQTLLREILAGVDPGQISLNFLKAADPVKLYRAILAYLEKEGIKPVLLKGNLGADPLGNMAASGKLKDGSVDELAAIIREAAEHTPAFRIIAVQAALFQDAGSSLSQELGYGLSMANQYMKELSEKGLAPGQIAKAMSFTFACGPDYFPEIAKLRAARWLWTAICSEWGIEAGQLEIFIHSRSATWNMTLYDPHVNMLRTTTEAMSGSLGGADEISVHPYDMLFREDHDFSSRIARNTQIILKEESYFNKVLDPASGSYYIEALTNSIAEKAWTYFLDIEEKGGFQEALKSGFLHAQVRELMTLKKAKASSRKQSILGVNQYPNFDEFILGNLATKEHSKDSDKEDFPALHPFRVAEELEQLRLQTERSASRPKVFLLKFGDPAWTTARAMFSGNFFAAAGYLIIARAPFKTIEAGIQDALKEKADIVVLCSSDDQYAAIGPHAKELLGTNARLVIAGYPTDTIDELRAKGIDQFIHMKSNLLEDLKKYHSLLNIQD